MKECARLQREHEKLLRRLHQIERKLVKLGVTLPAASAPQQLREAAVSYGPGLKLPCSAAICQPVNQPPRLNPG
jgi:hypothetical protein